MASTPITKKMLEKLIHDAKEIQAYIRSTLNSKQCFTTFANQDAIERHWKPGCCGTFFLSVPNLAPNRDLSLADDGVSLVNAHGLVWRNLYRALDTLIDNCNAVITRIEGDVDPTRDVVVLFNKFHTSGDTVGPLQMTNLGGALADAYAALQGNFRASYKQDIYRDMTDFVNSAQAKQLREKISLAIQPFQEYDDRCREKADMQREFMALELSPEMRYTYQ